MLSRRNCLATQLAPPRLASGIVDRPRLTERLERGRTEPVTLICAAAGSGKTTLAASTTSAWPGPVAWVSLEPSDNTPERLWNAVLAGLECSGVAAPGSALAELAAPLDRAEGVFAPLLANALSELSEPAALVLDDLHHVRSRACIAQLSWLVLHLPDTLRLVLIGRAEPPLPLHRLRVSGRLVELRGRDLAFTERETAALLEAQAVNLRADLVRSLQRRTEGWAAGLRLAALSLQGRDDPEPFVMRFAGDDRTIADYLLTEVLDQQSPRMRSFCLRACLVDKVCGELADVLTGACGGADTLAEFDRANAFVERCDGRGEWYRFHTLFAHVLRARAKAEIGDEIPALRARAARWYAAQGLPADALEQAALAEDWETVATVVADSWFELYLHGDAERVAALISRVPEPWRSGHGELAAALACVALDTGDRPAAERHLADAEREAASLPEHRRGHYRQTLALARLTCAQLDGDYETARAAGDELLNVADGARPEWQALVHAMLGQAALWAHQLDRAEVELRRAIEAARSCRLDHVAIAAMGDLAYVNVLAHGPAGEVACAGDALALAHRRGWGDTSVTASAHTALATAALYACRDDECLEHLTHATAVIAGDRRRQLDLVLSCLHAQVLGARGDVAAGLRGLEDWEARHRGAFISPRERITASCQRARLHLLAGNLPEAALALDPFRDDDCVDVHVADARVQLAAGGPDQALTALAAAGARDDSHPVLLIERLVLEAVAHHQLRSAAASRLALEAALGHAARTGYVRPFLHAGRAQIETLLRDHIRAVTPERRQASALLDVVQGTTRALRPIAPLLEPLTDRELVVLRCLPTTLSNREIADELFIAVNTVKTHVRGIYRKLNVADRREAVTRARELRLIS